MINRFCVKKADRFSERTNQSLPLHKGGLLPPDSRQKSVINYILQGKACEKEYEQIVCTPFVLRQAKSVLW